MLVYTVHCWVTKVNFYESSFRRAVYGAQTYTAYQYGPTEPVPMYRFLGSLPFSFTSR